MSAKTDTNDQSPPLSKPNFGTTELCKNVYDYVKVYMSRYDMSHDFDHVLRVAALAKHILAKEIKASPETTYDEQTVILAALLHDVGDKKYAQPGEKAENLITDLLKANGCSENFISKVNTIVENVSYSNEVKYPDTVQEMLEAHPELAIVQDADRLDAVGAVGIARCFAFGAAKAPERGLDGSIEHFEEKLVKIEGMMKTATGKELARERTRRLTEFRRWYLEESRLWCA